MALVSVIIPVYNVVGYIAETLHSVFDQSHTNIEIILVDDGSTDGTKDIVQSILDPRLHYYYQNNQGVSAARNFGLQKAHGHFIQFLDGDDLLSPNKIELQLNLLQHQSSPSVIYGDAEYFFKWDTTHHKVPTPYQSNFFADLVSGKYILPIHSMLFPASIFTSFGLFTTTLHGNEDWLLWLTLSEHGVNFIYQTGTTVYYRLRPGSASADPIFMYNNLLTAINTFLQTPLSAKHMVLLIARRGETELLRLQYFARQRDLRSFWKYRAAISHNLFHRPFLAIKTFIFGCIALIGGKPLWQLLDTLARAIVRPTTVQNNER